MTVDKPLGVHNDRVPLLLTHPYAWRVVSSGSVASMTCLKDPENRAEAPLSTAASVQVARLESRGVVTSRRSPASPCSKSMATGSGVVLMKMVQTPPSRP